MQQWHDSDTYEGEQFSGEEDFGEILVAQNSGGRTCTTEFCPSEWKKNLRMDRDVFIALADEIRPYLQPGRSPRGLDVLSVEKQLAMTLYFLKDQGSLSMTANAFGITRCTVSVIVRKVCDVIARVLRPKYIKLPSTKQQMKDIVKGVEDKYGF